MPCVREDPRGRAQASLMLTVLLIASVAPAHPRPRRKRADGHGLQAAAKGCHTRFGGRTRRTAVVRARRAGRPAWCARACAAAATGTSASSTPGRGASWPARPRFGGREVAEGFVRKGQRLLVQACRFRGRAAHARVCRPLRRLEGRAERHHPDRDRVHALARGQDPAPGPRPRSHGERRRPTRSTCS